MEAAAERLPANGLIAARKRMPKKGRLKTFRRPTKHNKQNPLNHQRVLFLSVAENEGFEPSMQV